MKAAYSLIAAVLAVSLLLACGRPAGPQPAPPEKASQARPGWQQEWDKTLAAAKTEGKVVAFTSFGGQATNTIAAAVKEKLGLDLEFIVGRGPENITKAQNERRSGLYLEDINMGGLSELALFKDAGFLQPVAPALLLPEVLDSKAWMGNEVYIPDKDKGGLTLAYQSRVVGPLVVNTDIVKPDEIKSYRDLLNPKWKGKIVFFDPTKGGHGPITFMIFWEFMGEAFTRELAKQDLVIAGDARQQTEWVARGKYPITGVMASEMQAEFQKAGAPLKTIVPSEGTFLSASKGALGIMDRAPHPNAVRALVNWILTKEGQTLMSKVAGDPSRRLDVTREFVVDQALIPQPGGIYRPSDSEEMIKKRIELQKVAAEVWNIK